MYEMKDEYLTGIEAIDKEHRRLFEIAEELYQLCQNELVYDKYDQLVAVFNELKDYTHLHFAHEEEYMESIQYKKLFTQKIQHNAFCEKLDSLSLDEMDENQSKTIEDLLTFVTDWLVHHILETDKQIALG